MCNRFFMHDLKFSMIILLVSISFFQSQEASQCLAQEQKKALGELKIEGMHIERLVLCRKDGRTEQFDKPQEIIKLAVGEYRLQDVRLKDGYTSNNLRTSTHNWVVVTDREPAALKVGAPLKQAVKIERRGSILELNYNLTGVGGETYASTRNKRPAFTVFKGEKKVATGEFEFG